MDNKAEEGDDKIDLTDNVQDGGVNVPLPLLVISDWAAQFINR